jgi:hypothetical protein
MVEILAVHEFDPQSDRPGKVQRGLETVVRRHMRYLDLDLVKRQAPGLEEGK